MIPLKYNLRNLRVRWVTTLMTVLATGLVVWATVLTFGLTDGLDHALRVTGDPLDLMVLRKGANDETSSTITPDMARQIAALPGIAADGQGTALSSAEFVTILTKPRRDGGGTTNLIVRGLTDVGRALRPAFQIVEGRDLTPGVNEAITSRQMAGRFENLRIGESLDINQVQFRIVGYFEAGGSAAESEVWADLRDLTGARRQQGAISIVQLRAVDAAAKKSLTDTLRDDEQFKLNPLDEVEFYE
ncbi:MAG: ABC transporter permease, partial [Planctomycetales bacterium]|nr:ABC transporter permease [Planctomycetales bacterium]